MREIPIIKCDVEEKVNSYMRKTWPENICDTWAAQDWPMCCMTPGPAEESYGGEVLGQAKVVRWGYDTTGPKAT